MRFPLSLTTNMAGYMVKQKLAGVKKFPLVLMLEPLHACNLTCTGCGRIREYEDTIKEVVPLEKCLEAVEDSGAPIVSICGGEPLDHVAGTAVSGLLACGEDVQLVESMREVDPAGDGRHPGRRPDGVEEGR